MSYDKRVATAVNAIRAALSNRQLVLMLGAGVSAAATNGHPLSMWQGLVNNAIDRCVDLGARNDAWAARARDDVKSQYDEDLIAAAEKATSGLGGRTGVEYRRWLRDTVGSLSIQDRTLTDVIARYAGRGSLIATTNYDNIPSEATGWQTATWRDSTMIQRVYRGDDQAIIHVHGHWQEPETVVFGSSSYADVLSDQQAAQFLHMLMWGKTIVFCGFGAGLRDPNFSALRAWIAATFPDSEYSHYRLVRDSEVADADAEHRPEEHIIAVPFGSDHADLPTFLDAVLSSGPFRAHGGTTSTPAVPHTTTVPTIPIATPPARAEDRDALSQIADRLATVRAVATDTTGATSGFAGAGITPTVRDTYIRFHNIFEDESDFVTQAASNSQLTQTQADEALGVGGRLIALLNNPPVM